MNRLSDSACIRGTCTSVNFSITTRLLRYPPQPQVLSQALQPSLLVDFPTDERHQEEPQSWPLDHPILGFLRSLRRCRRRRLLIQSQVRCSMGMQMVTSNSPMGKARSNQKSQRRRTHPDWRRIQNRNMSKAGLDDLGRGRRRTQDHSSFLDSSRLRCHSSLSRHRNIDR